MGRASARTGVYRYHAASDGAWARFAYDDIVAAARASGARLVLGTGIVPGISNVMVRAMADTLGGADEIETALLLNAGDRRRLSIFCRSWR